MASSECLSMCVHGDASAAGLHAAEQQRTELVTQHLSMCVHDICSKDFPLQGSHRVMASVTECLSVVMHFGKAHTQYNFEVGLATFQKFRIRELMI